MLHFIAIVLEEKRGPEGREGRERTKTIGTTWQFPPIRSEMRVSEVSI